jgi:TPR repeat protein
LRAAAVDLIPLYFSAWRNGLQRPIYVPSELSSIRSLLSRGNVEDATGELLRLSILGSNSAAATLGYIALTWDRLQGEDRLQAARLCRSSAERGHSYAQYVEAWREYEEGNIRKFAQWLNRSARQRFLPAIGDLGRLFVAPSSKLKRHPRLARQLFRLAMRSGHLASAVTYLQACKQGNFGSLHRSIGTLLLPLAILLVTPIAWMLPFSVTVFAYPAGRVQKKSHAVG